MKIGINKIGFYAPEFYIEQEALAAARNIDPHKFTQGLGQLQMAVCPITQDAISMAANAAYPLLDDHDRQTIDLVIFATESGTDASKSGATTIHHLLNIQPNARCFEIKHACYGLTAALHSAHAHVALYPNAQVLIVGSDISRYGLNTSGEPTQGAGAVAMIISQAPRIASLVGLPAYYSEDIYDFFRPEGYPYAIVDGHYSNEKYMEFFHRTLNHYLQINDTSINQFDALCFHIPYTKIGLKSLRSISSEEDHPYLYEAFNKATSYNKRIGNIYTGSLYLSLISLLESATLTPQSIIGLFSYGSGAVGEFFSLQVEENYSHFLQKDYHEDLLERRKLCDIGEYEEVFKQELIKEASHHDTQYFYLEGIFNEKRRYNSNV